LGFAGGLVGWNQQNGTVTESYATAAATATEPDTGTAGGLVGYNQGSVDRSYATGAVDGTGDVGGLVGLNDDNNYGTVDSSYWDTDSTGQSGSGAVTGLTTAEMQGGEADDNMSGLGFPAVWATVDAENDDAAADDYPVLQALDRATQLEART
jgi:hypothetical protein